jgi:hypothetical protein
MSSIRFADSPLDCVMGWTAVPSTPSSANRTLVGYTVSTLHRPTGRAVIPSPSVTVAGVRWWVIVAVVWRPRVIILRLGRHGCAKGNCANAASGQKYSLCTHCVALIFSSGHIVSRSHGRGNYSRNRFGWSERPQMVRGCLIGRAG